MALTTMLRVIIEGDAGGLISQLTKAGRESRNVFSEVSRSAKAEFAKASHEADQAFKKIAELQAKAARADKIGNTPLATAFRSQAAAKQAEYDKLSAVAVAAEKRIQAEALKTVSAHAAETAGVSRLGGAYAQQGGAVSRFLASFKDSGASAKGVTVLKDSVASLGKGTGVLGGVTSAASTGLRELGANAALSGKGLGVAAVGATAAAVGIGVIGKTVESGLKHFVEYGREINKVRNITGATTQDSSLLAGQFRHFGVDVDAGSKALAIFATNANNAGGDKLEKLGIHVERFKNGQVDLTKTLVNAGDAFKRYGETSAEGTALAKNAFGRGGTAIIPILKQEREELEAINRSTKAQGLMFSDKDRKDALALGISMRELHHSFEGLQVSAAKGLAPMFTEQTQGAAKFLDTLNVVTQKVGGFGGVLNKLTGESGLAGITKLGAKALPGVGQIASVFEGFAGKTSQAAKDQKIFADAMSHSDEEATGFVAKMLKSGYTLDQVNQKIQQSGKSMEELEAGASIAPVFDSLGHAMTKMANDAKFAGEESDTLNAKLAQLGAGAISLASTETNVAAAQDALGKALKDNGADFDNHTEKGRANRQMLEQDASAILANVNALSAQGAGVQEVSTAWDTQVGALTRTLRASGATDAQIQVLLRDYGLIPATKETVVNANTAQAEARLRALIEQLNHLQRTDFQVNVAGGFGPRVTAGSHFRAVGGPVKQRHEYQVTERGPELFIAEQKSPTRVGKLAQLKHKADESAQETLVRLGIPGGVAPKATRKGAPALLLNGKGPQKFVPPADGVIVNATDTKRLQRTEDEDVITRILKKAGADRRTLEAMSNASAPQRGAGGRVEHGETYKISERGNEAFFPKFEFNAPKKATPTMAGPGIKRGSDGSYTISVGDTHLTVQGETAGSAKGVNKRDVDRIVERKQAELVAELVAAMRRSD